MPAVLRQSFNTNAILGASFVTGVTDTEDPVLPAGITVSAITNGTFSTTCGVGTDDVGVVAYDVRENGGEWINNGLSRTYNHTGKVQLTAYTIEWSCRDGAGKRSNIESVVVTTYRNGALGQDILDNTGPIGGGYPGILFDRVEAGEEDDWFWAYMTEDPATGVLTLNPNGTYIFTGPDATEGLVQFGKNADAVGDPVPVYFYTQDLPGEDTVAPTLTGAITEVGKTQTSISISWPAGSDNVAVVSYEVSSNAGGSWTDVGNVLAHTFTGLTHSTGYDLRVRAKDGVPLVSTPPLGLYVVTASPDTTSPVFTGDITVTDLTDTSYTLSWPAATDNVGVTGYEVSLNNGSSYTPVGLVLTTGISGRTALATDLVRVRAFDAAGNRSGFLSSSVTLLDTPDTTPPELSLPTATATGATTANATVTTDEAGGALFWVRTANLTEDKNDVVATGATQPVTASGLQTYGVTGLDPESTGRVHTVHRDAAGNVSDTVSSDEFTTNAFGGGAGGNSTGLSIGLRIGL